MLKRLSAVLAIVMLPAMASALITEYHQDFESLIIVDPAALADDGWVVYGSVFDPTGTTWLYGYGTFPAPNDGAAFCAIADQQGGVEQGLQQLSIYSDYNNLDHGVGNIIESNTFREMTIDAANVGETWSFDFDAKLGNIVAPSEAFAFIKTIDPANNYNMTNFINVETTAIDVTWQRYHLEIDIIPELEGQLLQIGFMNTATNYESSGIFYDNLDFQLAVTDVPAIAGVELSQNHPNPFNPSTRIEFALDDAGWTDLSIYDLAGRRVAVLHAGDLPAGDHHVTWNGKSDNGAAVAAGQYRYVLTTPAGTTSRSMMLLK